MAGIVIPRRRRQTQTPTPSSASPDTRPLEAALSRMAQTFDAVGRAREENRLNLARTKFSASLTDRYSQSLSDPGYEDLDERYTQASQIDASDIASEFGLSGNSLREFEAFADNAIASRSTSWNAEARRREVRQLTADYKSQLDILGEMYASGDLTAREEARDLMADVTKKTVEAGIVDPVAADNAVKSTIEDALMGRAAVLDLRDKMDPDGGQALFDEIAAGGFDDLPDHKLSVLMLKAYNSAVSNSDEAMQRELREIQYRRTKRDEAGRTAKITLSEILQGTAPGTEEMSLADRQARASEVAEEMLSSRWLEESDRIAIARIRDRTVTVTDTATYNDLRRKIVFGLLDSDQEIRDAAGRGELAWNHEGELYQLYANYEDRMPAAVRETEKGLITRFEAFKLGGPTAAVLGGQAQVRAMEMWSDYIRKEGATASMDQLRARANDIAYEVISAVDFGPTILDSTVRLGVVDDPNSMESLDRLESALLERYESGNMPDEVWEREQAVIDARRARTSLLDSIRAERQR